MKKIKYEFRNEVTEEAFILYLSGRIGENYFEDDNYISAEMVREALQGVEQPIIIKLNSAGGDAYQGIEIYNYLKDHPQHITVEVTGWAASAGSIVCMGANKVVMNTGTTMLIHNASGMVYGNADDIENYGRMVRTLDSSIVDIYVERTGISRKKIIDWMNVEQTFNAKECLQHGFADKVKSVVENMVQRHQAKNNKVNVILKNLQTLGTK
ncbi:head maturation protease, ClpP-related [Fundicoccus sp. Sow4_H7]|uniref:head maturation protease, ClpP-related n=1 Tax=Fundicoccus sp. Sow4_H7 TaxID=3438784 RepID=UPI003F8FD609